MSVAPHHYGVFSLAPVETRLLVAREGQRTCTFITCGIRWSAEGLSREADDKALSPASEVPHCSLRARSSIG